jgi:single-strand DNA-binding protein
VASVNRVILIGNLGKDPEMRYLPSGEASATLALATTETWKDKQGAKQEKTDWHRVEFIGRTAEVCGEYLKKGSSVYVEGRISYDSWDDKATGEKKYMTRIRGDRMQMMGTKPGGGSGGDASFEDGGQSGGGSQRASAPSRPAAGPSGGSAPAAKKPAKMDDFDDDIPF